MSWCAVARSSTTRPTKPPILDSGPQFLAEEVAETRGLEYSAFMPSNVIKRKIRPQQVLDELGIALMTAPQITEPSFGLTWNDGVVLCSGDAFT